MRTNMFIIYLCDDALCLLTTFATLLYVFYVIVLSLSFVILFVSYSSVRIEVVQDEVCQLRGGVNLSSSLG